MSLELAKPSSPKGLPESIALDSEFTYSGVLARSNNYVSAQPENGYTQNQIITIPLPFEMLDFRSSTLQFTCTGVAAPGATYTRFNTDIRSIFQRITVRFGSKYVLDQQQQNLLYNIQNNVLDMNWATYMGAITTGTGSPAQRNADFLDPTKVYAIQLYHNEDSFFYNVFPLQKLGVQMYIDFYLAINNSCIETDVAGASYTVNNVQFHTASLVPSPTWDNLWNTKVNDKITYTYFTYENLFDANTLLAGTSRCQKTLNYKYSSLIGLIVVMQDLATSQNQTQLNKLNTFNFNNLDSAQLKLGSSVFPIDQKRSLSDLLSMYCETNGLSMRDTPGIAINYGSTNFVLAIPLAKFIKENRDIGGSLNGLNTSLGTSLTLELGFSAPLVNNQLMNLFAIVENTICYNPNGSITFYN